MNTFGNSSAEEGSGGGIGIAPASHVYGPANVHVLPCKIHYTGPAPVATYFRPRQAVASRDAGGQDENVPPPNEIERESIEQKSVEDAKEPEKHASAAEEEGVVAILSNRREGQVWEQKEDDPEESTARFRGRKLIGRKIAFPQGVHGVLFKEKPWPQDFQKDHEDLSSFWAAETSFQKVTVWGHDEVRRDTTVDRCLSWLEVSKSIHDP